MHVIDASALSAFRHDEPGATRVTACLDGSLIASIKLCEVIPKAKRFGADIDGLHEDLIELGIRIEPCRVQHALIAADLWQTTRSSGLSLADRAWSEITLPVAAEVIH